MGTDRVRRMALFIDGGTLTAASAASLLASLSGKGDLLIGRLHGCADKAEAAQWPAWMEDVGFVARGAAGGGRAGAELGLALDVVEMLQSRSLEAIAIASDDSHFASLALTIRAAGVAAYGFGSPRAPANYRAAFTEWTTLEEPAAALAPERPKAPVRRRAASRRAA